MSAVQFAKFPPAVLDSIFSKLSLDDALSVRACCRTLARSPPIRQAIRTNVRYASVELTGRMAKNLTMCCMRRMHTDPFTGALRALLIVKVPCFMQTYIHTIATDCKDHLQHRAYAIALIQTLQYTAEESELGTIREICCRDPEVYAPAILGAMYGMGEIGITGLGTAILYVPAPVAWNILATIWRLRAYWQQAQLSKVGPPSLSALVGAKRKHTDAIASGMDDDGSILSPFKTPPRCSSPPMHHPY